MLSVFADLTGFTSRYHRPSAAVASQSKIPYATSWNLDPWKRAAAGHADRGTVCFGGGALHGPVADAVAGPGVALSGTVPMGTL